MSSDRVALEQIYNNKRIGLAYGLGFFLSLCTDAIFQTKEAKAGVALLMIDGVKTLFEDRSICGGLLRKEICVWEDISIALARKHLEQSSDRTET